VQKNADQIEFNSELLGSAVFGVHLQFCTSQNQTPSG